MELRKIEYDKIQKNGFYNEQQAKITPNDKQCDKLAIYFNFMVPEYTGESNNNKAKKNTC